MSVTSHDDFEALVSATGLPLSAIQLDQIRAAWALVEPMLEANRNGRCNGSPELAHVVPAGEPTRGIGREDPA